MRVLQDRRDLLLAVIALASLVCSIPGWADTAPFQFSSAVPADQSTALLSDVVGFSKLELDQADPQLYSMMGITRDAKTDVHSQLISWVKDRVHIIVEESFDVNSSIVKIKPLVYPNSNLVAPAFSLRDSGAEVLMSNLGGEIYAFGKDNKVLLGVKIQGLGTVTLNSPRVGILQIGSGMFSQFQPDPTNGLTNAYGEISRLSVLFHEARHSDGNGASLSFSHSLCPAGHAYRRFQLVMTA